MFSLCFLLLVLRLGDSFALRHLVTFPEERDKNGITGTLYLFSHVSLRAFVGFMTRIPFVHVFHFVWTVPVWDVFLMKKRRLPGLRSWEKPTARGESLSSF